MSVSYYASEFFYWDSLEKFEGKNLAGLPDYETYEYVNETKRKKTGNKKSLRNTSLIDDSYYTFSDKYDKGDIVKQTQESGTELDTSQGMDEALLYVIGTKLTYGGETGAQVKAKLGSWNNVTVKYAGSMDPSQEALGVSIQNSEGREINYFKKGQSLTVVITTKEKPKPEASPRQKPKPKPKPKPYKEEKKPVH